MSALRGRPSYGAGEKAKAYARVGVESSAISATPHQLIMMLFDGALASIRTARIHMQDGSRSEKGKAISKALDIVNNGLLAALDVEKGGETAEQLASLYDYISRTLLKANLKNDIGYLDEASTLLENIGSAWREIGDRPGEV